MLKCPNCGAPMSGRICAYCGTAAAPSAPEAEQPDAASRGKRNALDIVLIVIGTFWLLLLFGAVVDMKMWSGAAEIVAVLMLASPGALLLLIGCRRKKPKQKKDHPEITGPADR